jgi:hypothetical protein
MAFISENQRQKGLDFPIDGTQESAVTMFLK